VPAALIALSAVPVGAGAFRVTQLATGAPVTEDNARFLAAPLPVLLHIVGATVYCVLGAFQFAPGPRRRRPGLHRGAGRLVVLCGLTGALAGLWMSLTYPRPPGDGELLTGFRLLFGAAMAVAIVLGVVAARRRDLVRHRAWMIRGYAIAQGAGTQAVVIGLWMLVAGTPGEVGTALLMAAAWALNLAVAEWLVRGRPALLPSPHPRETR
jgi:uncharacterized membrane protein